MYSDAVTSSDVDRAVDRAKSDLEYEIRRLGEELRSEIRNLERDVEGLRDRIRSLENAD